MTDGTNTVLDYLWMSAPLVVLELGHEGEVHRANRHAEQVLGADIAGREFKTFVVDFHGRFDLNDAARDPRRHCPLDIATVSGEVVSYRFNFLPAGEGRLALGAPDVEDVGRLQREVLGLNAELTNLGRELQKANAELKALSALKNEFLGMAAHDLRKPVGAIMAYTGFLLEDLADRLSEEEAGFLGTVSDAATRMRLLIDDFLDVAMIESGRLELKRESVALGMIVRGAVEIVGVNARKKHVPLRVELKDEEARLYADPPKLEQVLMNLLGNAVEHSTAGSTVTLTAGMDDGHAVFRVQDHAEGIPPEKIEQLFQAFERAGTRKTAGERSHGLGLAIAKRIVEAHGGEITVKSRVGEGSTFTVSVPRAVEVSVY